MIENKIINIVLYCIVPVVLLSFYHGNTSAKDQPLFLFAAVESIEQDYVHTPSQQVFSYVLTMDHGSPFMIKSWLEGNSAELQQQHALAELKNEKHTVGLAPIQSRYTDQGCKGYINKWWFRTKGKLEAAALPHAVLPVSVTFYTPSGGGKDAEPIIYLLTDYARTSFSWKSVIAREVRGQPRFDANMMPISGGVKCRNVAAHIAPCEITHLLFDPCSNSVVVLGICFDHVGFYVIALDRRNWFELLYKQVRDAVENSLLKNITVIRKSFAGRVLCSVKVSGTGTEIDRVLLSTSRSCKGSFDDDYIHVDKCTSFGSEIDTSDSVKLFTLDFPDPYSSSIAYLGHTFPPVKVTASSKLMKAAKETGATWNAAACHYGIDNQDRLLTPVEYQRIHPVTEVSVNPADDFALYEDTRSEHSYAFQSQAISEVCCQFILQVTDCCHRIAGNPYSLVRPQDPRITRLERHTSILYNLFNSPAKNTILDLMADAGWSIPLSLCSAPDVFLSSLYKPCEVKDDSDSVCNAMATTDVSALDTPTDGHSSLIYTGDGDGGGGVSENDVVLSGPLEQVSTSPESLVEGGEDSLKRPSSSSSSSNRDSTTTVFMGAAQRHSTTSSGGSGERSSQIFSMEMDSEVAVKEEVLAVASESVKTETTGEGGAGSAQAMPSTLLPAPDSYPDDACKTISSDTLLKMLYTKAKSVLERSSKSSQTVVATSAQTNTSGKGWRNRSWRGSGNSKSPVSSPSTEIVVPEGFIPPESLVDAYAAREKNPQALLYKCWEHAKVYIDTSNTIQQRSK
ncbi:hypothetical protein ACWJJH_01925 [Endozoicomonadaceae bacterium StTr2]